MSTNPPDSQQPGGSGGDAEDTRTNVRFRLKENPVHEHFTYSSSDDKSTCKLCKFRLAGKNSTSLGNLILFVFGFWFF
jgi:hypothetical protein